MSIKIAVFFACLSVLTATVGGMKKKSCKCKLHAEEKILTGDIGMKKRQLFNIVAEKSGGDSGSSGLTAIGNFNPIKNYLGSSGSGGSSSGTPGLPNLAGNQAAFTDFMTMASDPCTWKTLSGFMKLMADANKSQQKSEKL